MSAPSDGARADARKRLAAEVVASGDVAALAAALGDEAPVSWDFFPDPDLALDQIAAHVLASDWLAGVIADAKAEALREAADDIACRLRRGENPDLGYVAVAWLRDRAGVTS